MRALVGFQTGRTASVLVAAMLSPGAGEALKSPP